VYTSSSLALAALEFFVHVRPTRAPDDLLAIPADIPPSISLSRIAASDLASDWRESPAPEALADMGARWLRDGGTPVLVVPSAVIPHEDNYLLNPLHRAFRTIRIGSPERFTFEPRMWQR
jgi:RES domain-containing protein